MEIKDNIENKEIEKVNPNEEDINTNKINENSFISLNKDKLYETFYLFQKFLSCSQNEKINSISDNNKINQRLQEFMKQQNSTIKISKTEPNINNLNTYQSEETEEKIEMIDSNNTIENKNSNIYVRKTINEPPYSGRGRLLNIENKNKFYSTNYEKNNLKNTILHRTKNGIILSNITAKKKNFTNKRN